MEIRIFVQPAGGLLMLRKTAEVHLRGKAKCTSFAADAVSKPIRKDLLSCIAGTVEFVRNYQTSHKQEMAKTPELGLGRSEIQFLSMNCYPRSRSKDYCSRRGCAGDGVLRAPEGMSLNTTPAKHHDVNHEFALKMRDINDGRGLSIRDQSWLLDFINRLVVEGNMMKFTLKTTNDVKKTLKKIAEESVLGKKWKKETLKCLDVQFDVEYEDILDWLPGAYGDPSKCDGFIVMAKELWFKVLNEDGEVENEYRAYSSPDTAQHWINVQKAFGDEPLAAIQLYVDETLVNRKNQKVRPVKELSYVIRWGDQEWCTHTYFP
ncbi:hypothetical protein BSKO_02743 [Bryopsis sp. KO-2023]|nr:hypothetical protein BSKO_02743 [Bryopsis sp. KO-2023]